MRLDAYFSEYNQMYEGIKTHSEFMRIRESLFVVLSFGILSYTIAYDIDREDLLVAAFASLAIFAYYMHACENAIFVINMYRHRISDIEKKVNEILSDNVLAFQEQFPWGNLKMRVVAEVNALGHLNPVKWLSKFGIGMPIRIARMMMFLVLAALWIFRIIE